MIQSFGLVIGTKCNTMRVRHHCKNTAVSDTHTDTRDKFNTVVHDSICGSKCNNNNWSPPGNGTKWDNLGWGGYYLPNTFPDCLFINPFCAHVVFERSTDWEWHELSGTSSASRSNLLSKLPRCLQLKYKKNLPSTIINLLLELIGVTVICSILLKKIVALLSRYNVRCSDYIQ